MDFLQDYVHHYRDVIPKSLSGRLFLAVGLFYLPLTWFLTRDVLKSLFVTMMIYLFHCTFLDPPSREYDILRRGESVTLRLHGKQLRFHFLFYILVYFIPGLVLKIVGGEDRPKYHAKLFSDVLLNSMCEQRRIKVYSPRLRIPRRKIIITNHVHRPILDSLSLFPFSGREDPILILQHNFNYVITILGEWIWGAYTIDKDDKTPTGKKTLEKRLQSLVDIMKRETNLTVVVYTQGKVPKTNEETRKPSHFYPGAFYLSLMTGYPVMPLVNDYNGRVLTNSCLEPVDLLTREKDNIRFSDSVGEFREWNKTLLEELAEEFLVKFREEYREIALDEMGVNETKQEILNACRTTKNRDTGQRGGHHKAENHDSGPLDNPVELRNCSTTS